jgi:hypothetical protein
LPVIFSFDGLFSAAERGFASLFEHKITDYRKNWGRFFWLIAKRTIEAAIRVVSIPLATSPFCVTDFSRLNCD